MTEILNNYGNFYGIENTSPLNIDIHVLFTLIFIYVIFIYCKPRISGEKDEKRKIDSHIFRPKFIYFLSTQN